MNYLKIEKLSNILIREYQVVQNKRNLNWIFNHCLNKLGSYENEEKLIRQVEFSNKSSLIALKFFNGEIEIFDSYDILNEKPKVLKLYYGADEATSIEWTKDDKKLLIGQRDGYHSIMDIETLKTIVIFKKSNEHSDIMKINEVEENSNYIISGNSNSKIFTWDLRCINGTNNGLELWTNKIIKGQKVNFFESGNSNIVAHYSIDKTISKWDLKNGKTISELYTVKSPKFNHEIGYIDDITYLNGNRLYGLSEKSQICIFNKDIINDGPLMIYGEKLNINRKKLIIPLKEFSYIVINMNVEKGNIWIINTRNDLKIHEKFLFQLSESSVSEIKWSPYFKGLGVAVIDSTLLQIIRFDPSEFKKQNSVFDFKNIKLRKPRLKLKPLNLLDYI